MVTGLGAGSVVAGYRVESRIGAGGMAMVFRARDEALGRTVALKVLAPALADDTAFRERFIRESRAAAVVDHPHNVVRVRNTATGKLVATLAAPSGTNVEACALSPDGTKAAAADSNGYTYVWRIAS